MWALLLTVSPPCTAKSKAIAIHAPLSTSSFPDTEPPSYLKGVRGPVLAKGLNTAQKSYAGATDAARGAADIVLTQPGLSTITSAIIGARKIFQRMATYAKYTVAMTFRICFTFGLLTVIYNWCACLPLPSFGICPSWPSMCTEVFCA